MSEESKTTAKITSVVKTKDPRRVEAGKRLGMISKQAKERKAREQSERASEANKNEWFPPIGSIGSPAVGIGFVGLVGLVLYYAYSKKYKTVKSEEQTVGTEVVSEVKPKRVYKELDTLD